MASGRRLVIRTAALFAGSAVMLAAGWFAASVFVSPEQRAADAEAPPPTVLTAEVVREDLVQTTSGTARVESTDRREVVVPQGGALSVVTASPVSEGDSVAECSNALEVNGRPRIVVEGAFTFYRDLAEGDYGPDVSQLQAAMNRCGANIVVDGIFGPATARAVAGIYESLEYDLPEAKTPVVTEFLVVPALPVVLEAGVPVGEFVTTDTVLTLGSGPLVVIAEAPESVVRADLELIASSVRFDDDERDAMVKKLRSQATEDAFAVVELEILDGNVSEDWKGVVGVATYIAATVANDALIVPTSSVVSSGLDEQVVYVSKGNGTFISVNVREIGTLNGRTAVEPIDGRLEEGDLVLVSGL